MRRLRAPLIVLVLAATALSGCADDGRGPPASTLGAIEGRVLDDAQLTLEGARVRILLTDFETTTDFQGRFDFEGVPPGPVRTVASSPGYGSQTRSAVLPDRGLLHFEFQLTQVPVPRPRLEPLHFTGTVACGLPLGTQCGPAGDDPSTTHRFEVEPGLAGIVLELVWEPPAAAAGNSLRFTLMAATDEACGTPFADAAGPTVLRLEPEEGFSISGGDQCVTVSAGPDGLTAQQAYELYVTLAYWEPAPEGYSALPER